MRYAIFTDIHANIEALEAVLAKIDEIAEEKPIDQIWFLGDLVGYGPNPNECIKTLRERTDVIIAGNHDWAAVGKIDLEDFSTAARIFPKNGLSQNGESSDEEQSGDEAELVLIQPNLLPTKVAAHAESAYADPETGLPATEEEANAVIEAHQQDAEQTPQNNTLDDENGSHKDDESSEATLNDNEEDVSVEDEEAEDDAVSEEEVVVETDVVTPEEVILSAEDRLSGEIEELLTLLGLSESMIQVTNEMLLPPEGQWVAPEGYRAIVNPGGVGQPRDGDPRAAFMIYDTESGFEFYRVPYAIEVTQEKIIQAGLPPYLAARLSVGR